MLARDKAERVPIPKIFAIAKIMKSLIHIPFLLSVFFLTVSCKSTVDKAVRDTKYSALEMFGLQKRDLLQREVKNAREEQEEATEDFKDALQKLKALYNIERGPFDEAYEDLNSSYQDAKKQAADVSQSIKKVETVAGDLFLEWEKEINEINTNELKVASAQSLNQTKKRYAEMIVVLKASEKRIAPILSKLKDHVLYLKHKLNAKAISGLQGESMRIQVQIEQLIEDINKAIKAADQFISDTKNS